MCCSGQKVLDKAAAGCLALVSSGFHRRDRRKKMNDAFTDHRARLESKSLEENHGIQAGNQGVGTDK